MMESDSSLAVADSVSGRAIKGVPCESLYPMLYSAARLFTAADGIHDNDTLPSSTVLAGSIVLPSPQSATDDATNVDTSTGLLCAETKSGLFEHRKHKARPGPERGSERGREGGREGGRGGERHTHTCSRSRSRSRTLCLCLSFPLSFSLSRSLSLSLSLVGRLKNESQIKLGRVNQCAFVTDCVTQDASSPFLYDNVASPLRGQPRSIAARIAPYQYR